MSQEKVDKYKNYKNNRDKIQKKEARELLLEKIIVSAVCLLIVGWIGYSRSLLQERQPNRHTGKAEWEMLRCISFFLVKREGTDSERRAARGGYFTAVCFKWRNCG